MRQSQLKLYSRKPIQHHKDTYRRIDAMTALLREWVKGEKNV